MIIMSTWKGSVGFVVSTVTVAKVSIAIFNLA